MTAEECYKAFGGDYHGTLDRLFTEDLIEKYLGRFLHDPCYRDLVSAFEAGGERDKEAFQAVHTLKGLCLNLGMTKLAASSGRLTEALRFGRQEGAEALLQDVQTDYEEIVSAIRQLVGD